MIGKMYLSPRTAILLKLQYNHPELTIVGENNRFEFETALELCAHLLLDARKCSSAAVRIVPYEHKSFNVLQLTQPLDEDALQSVSCP